jgi:hypothetical protein
MDSNVPRGPPGHPIQPAVQRPADEHPNGRRIIRWAALAGNWTIEDGRVHYRSRSSPGGHGLAVCNESFQDGVVRSTIRLETNDGAWRDASAGIALGYNRDSGGYLVAGLGGFDMAFAIWEFAPSNGWVPRRGIGTIQNLRSNQAYEIAVTKTGQRISLVVDDVSVLEHVVPSPLPGNQLGVFTMSDSPVLF